MIRDSPFRTAWKLQRSAANPANLPFPASAPTIRAAMQFTLNTLQKAPYQPKCATPMCLPRSAALPDFFRAPTARKLPCVRIALPAEEEGETDDSKYAMPTRHCSGHTSVTVDPSYLGPDEPVMAPAVPAPVELVLFPALDQAAPAPGLPRACRTDQDATKFIPKKL